jgi:anti-anti-sigma factor
MLKVRIENLGQTAVLHVRGHIVIGTETEVLHKAVLAQTGVGAVVLDLTWVSRIDARGLGLLLELRERLQSGGIEFRLMNVSRLVEQILKMTCLDGVFETAREDGIRTRDSLELVLEESIS